MPGSSYELYYLHMMPICAHDDSYGSVMRIIGMSVCLRCRAGFGRSPRSRATSGRSAPSERPNPARGSSSCPNLARERRGVWNRPEQERSREGTRPNKNHPGVGRARWRLASSVPSPSPVITERLPTDRVPLRNLPYDSPIYALRRTLPHGDNAGRGCFERKATYGRCTCTPR